MSPKHPDFFHYSL